MSIWAALGIVLVVGAILSFARKSGKDAVKAQIGEQNAKAAERIAEATANSPSNVTELHERLRDPSRKL